MIIQIYIFKISIIQKRISKKNESQINNNSIFNVKVLKNEIHKLNNENH